MCAACCAVGRFVMINACFAYVAIPPCDHVLLVLQVLMMVFCVVVVCGVQKHDSRDIHNLERLLGSGGQLPQQMLQKVRDSQGGTTSLQHVQGRRDPSPTSPSRSKQN